MVVSRMREAASVYKGVIECPRCKEKTVVEDGSHGCVSIRCGNCRKYIRLNLDEMTAKEAGAIRGLTRMKEN